ncbi:deoxycytidylate deaminase-like [Mytilus californianus]|uniref:deoxycytidylate deaminase-like n=1 Tax=Mytilus californianus TaxID=6549 RepID=UPI0022452810|nr:deoxycytidylate deaminase-like [Mytilus californianus]XP_052078736.1 deoxycytidylate deaminase-like [Mytilus californianus]
MSMETAKPKKVDSSMETAKRSGYLELDEYFMALCFVSAQRSEDPKTQVGACIVNQDKRIVGMGYNGMPDGRSDTEFPWTKGDTAEDDKHLYVCHAELNAITNKIQADIQNCRLFVILFPCNECAKLIVQSGIKEVVYYESKTADLSRKDEKATSKMFEHAGIKVLKYDPKRKTELRIGKEEPKFL